MVHDYTEDQKMLKQSITKFCEKEFNKEFVRWMDENCNWIPEDIWKKLADMGIFGLTVSEKNGGSGLSVTEFAIVMEEIGKASAGAAIAVFTQVGFGAKFFEGMGNEEQQKFHLPKIISGEKTYCMALTEPRGGTDILNALRSTAIKKGDKFILNGQKVFISGGHIADYMIVVCITDPQAKKRTEAISVFVVDAKSPGITTRLIPKVSMHACGTAEIFFEDVVIPAENLVGELHNGWGKLTEVLNSERISVAAISLGIAKAAYELAYEYSLQREAFGRQIGGFQILQHYMVDMMIGIENTENIIRKCCWLHDHGLPYNIEAAMAKIISGKASEFAAIQAMEILGGYGVCMEYDAQRYFRDYKQAMFSPISEEMAYNMIARWSGLPKSF